MRLFKISIIVLILHSCVAKQPLYDNNGNCNYYKNEIDEFTNERIKQTYFKYLTDPNLIPSVYTKLLKVGGMKKNDDRYLKISLILKNRGFNVQKGRDLMFLDLDNNVIKLKFPETKTSKYDRNGNSFYLVQNFKLNDTQFEKFKESKFKKIRYYTMDGYVNIDIDLDKRILISQIMKCIE